MNKSKKHGGPRKGAGRKKGPEKVKLGICVLLGTASDLVTIGDGSYSKGVERLVAAHKETDGE